MRACEGMTVLVVGASSGIGRAVAIRLADAGAMVVAAARRAESLQSLREESGDRIHMQTCDVRDPDACEAVVAGTVKECGQLDALVYCAGVSPLRALVDADAELWHDVLNTSVVGANLVCRSALPHLRAAHGRVVFLGSSSVGRPFPGLTPYAASKAALSESIRGWRAENPDVSFTSLIVGPTGETEFTASWDQDLAGEMFPYWQANGYLSASASMSPAEIGDAVLSVLTLPGSVHVAWVEACDRAATPLR